MNIKQNIEKKAIIASTIVGIILAVRYHLKRIPQTQNTIIGSMLLLGALGVYFTWKSGKRGGVLTYFLIGLVGCTIEGIGIATCRPYGCFHYSTLLGPKFFDTFPLLLIGIWPFLVLSIAHLVPPKFTGKDFIAVGVLLLLILDLALDPVHIIQGIRSYEPAAYNWFGVPLQNFVGWILTGGISMYVVQKREITITNEARYYSGITIMILFRIQFLFGALFR